MVELLTTTITRKIICDVDVVKYEDTISRESLNKIHTFSPDQTSKKRQSALLYTMDT